MPYTNAQARQQLLDTVAQATDELAIALASLGEAYEHLDEANADRLEQEIFRPVQIAYGRAQRAYKEFAGRYGLPGHTFTPASPGAPSHGVKGFLDSAVAAVSGADRALSTLQDSMLPIEVGDAALRADLQEVRELLGEIPGRTHRLVRTLGR